MPDDSAKPYQNRLRPVVRNGRYELEGYKPSESIIGLLKWKLSGERKPWPNWIDNNTHPAPPDRVSGDDVSVTWIGHATCLVQTHGLNILTDPFFSLRASPVQFAGPKRVRHPGIALEDLPPIDIVLLSHNHYDHLDLPTLKTLARKNEFALITSTGNARHLSKIGGGARIHEYDWYDTHEHGGLAITPSPALHWSKRTFFDRNKALWSAFYVQTPSRRIYFAADTAFGEGEHFTSTREDFGPPDVALMPIGAYEPHWFMKHQHVNPEHAVRAHKLLGARHSLAIHHSTIQLTDEAIDAPVNSLEDARSRHGLSEQEFRVLDVGETWQL
jgi:L-ascorbate metabolism protein UlaG (beta-lactamase superfamily)